MPLISWSANYSVNIAEIDKQHQKLIEIINTLFDAMKEGKANDVMTKVFNELVTYTIYHFTFEEKMMSTNGFPELDSHKLEHIELTNKVKELQKKASSSNFTVSIETMNFLKEWLMKHISGTDKKYTSFLNAKGIK